MTSINTDDFAPGIRNAAWWSSDSRLAANGRAADAILVKQGKKQPPDLSEVEEVQMVMLDEPEPSPFVVPLYTAPPQREWQGLTDEEIAEIAKIWLKGNHMLPFPLARAIEAKLKEKNLTSEKNIQTSDKND